MKIVVLAMNNVLLQVILFKKNNCGTNFTKKSAPIYVCP